MDKAPGPARAALRFPGGAFGAPSAPAFARLTGPPMLPLSIVVPCYNEQDVLAETAKRLLALRSRLIAAGKISEGSRIVFVDDGSRDRTWPMIEALAASGLPVVGLKLSRNSGHQNALLAGLFAAPGEAIVSVDADLQDDTDAIESMVDHYRQGCDIVYGVRSSRETDTVFKRASAGGFYRLMELLGAQTVRDHADYRLLSRRAIEALREYGETNLYLRGIIPLLGFRSATVEYARRARIAGESKYPLRRMLSLALNAVTSFSVVPLRLISAIGVLVFLASLFVLAWTLWVALFTGRAVPGWASITLPIYFLGGIQLLSLGVIGEYLGRLYIEAKRRPRYFIERIVDGAPSAAGAAGPGPGALNQRS
jgi:glycosyltransferase involved in cell wall biosynthesis